MKPVEVADKIRPETTRRQLPAAGSVRNPDESVESDDTPIGGAGRNTGSGGTPIGISKLRSKWSQCTTITLIINLPKCPKMENGKNAKKKEEKKKRTRRTSQHCPCLCEGAPAFGRRRLHRNTAYARLSGFNRPSCGASLAFVSSNFGESVPNPLLDLSSVKNDLHFLVLLPAFLLRLVLEHFRLLAAFCSLHCVHFQACCDIGGADPWCSFNLCTAHPSRRVKVLPDRSASFKRSLARRLALRALLCQAGLRRTVPATVRNHRLQLKGAGRMATTLEPTPRSGRSAPHAKGASPGRVCRSSQRCVPGGLRLTSRLHARGRLSGEHSCKRLCDRYLRRYQARDSSGSFSHGRIIHVVARCFLSTAGTSAYRVALGLVSIWKPISGTYDHLELEAGSTNDVAYLLPEG